MNNTDVFLRELFLKENKVYTGNVDNSKEPNKNSKTVASYIWATDYEPDFEPHLFLVKLIINEKKFEKDFMFCKKHELFKERFSIENENARFEVLVYSLSKMWKKRIVLMTQNSYDWLPMENNIPYLYKEIINRTEKGFKIFENKLSSFGLRPLEIENVIRDAKRDDRLLWTGFEFKNECIAYDKTSQKQFDSWLKTQKTFQN